MSIDVISKEKAIGRKYALELRNDFKSQISVLNKKTGATSKIGYRVRFRDLMLQSIAVRTTKVPFINHFGVDKERQAHQVKSKLGKIYTRKAHPFKLNSKISDLTISETLVNNFADEISELRGDKVLAEIANQFSSKSNHQVS